LIGRYFEPDPAAPSAAPLARRDELLRQGPRRNPTQSVEGFTILPAAKGPYQLGSGATLHVSNPQAKPPTGAGLSTMSFNILKGGERRDELIRYLQDLERQDRMPDVIALQEANQTIAAHLAETFGFHLAYHGRERDLNGRLVNGKAVLSRHLIEEAVHFTYGLPEKERQEAIRRKGKVGELAEDRGALRVTLQVDGRHVDLYDVHHTLGDAGINASQLRQLSSLVDQSRKASREVVVAGDFNANTMIKQPGSRALARGDAYEATDTLAEFKARYGDGAGNIADAGVRRAFQELARLAPDAWGRGAEPRTRRTDGSLMTARTAQDLLNSGTVAVGSEAWRRLQDVADGVTLTADTRRDGTIPAMGKRFDAFFATLQPTLVEIDRSTSASDHQPLIAHFAL
jgi:endonuclease/exonuclease/phosphatase family metal-dependent hydrolase